ncbi:MAG TPA: exosortase/archaeosortase family protein [Chthonomonadaceae bacterium]|nr:exosortase/archaeosortase family protein [Chthonomonadaceae bacterium]
MISGSSLPAPRLWLMRFKSAAIGIGQWPRTTQLFALALLLLYIPVVRDTARAWFTDENYAHGVFIFPITAFLIWTQRQAIRRAVPQPTMWGLALLAGGLLLEIAGYLVPIEFLAMVSLIPVLAGSILLLHGKALWKVVRFPVYFLFFAAPLPGFFLGKISVWIQGLSATGSAQSMKLLGYTIVQTGNLIDIPGMRLGVEEACSGFKKLLALLAFALLYGYLNRLSPGKRMLLVLVAIPIAIVANILRIMALIAVSSAGGLTAFHAVHDWAEVFVLIIAFGMFMLFGKLIGCKTEEPSP